MNPKQNKTPSKPEKEFIWCIGEGNLLIPRDGYTSKVYLCAVELPDFDNEYKDIIIYFANGNERKKQSGVLKENLTKIFKVNGNGIDDIVNEIEHNGIEINKKEIEKDYNVLLNKLY